MNWQQRRRLQKAISLAAQRIRHSCTPPGLAVARFLRKEVDWGRIGVPHNRSALVRYSRTGKYGRVKYLIGAEDLAWFKQQDPFGNHQALLTEADLILSHRIQIHGLGRVDLGPTIDWSRDPVTGQRYPEGLFSYLPDSRLDGRFRAEQNLHRHFPVLAIGWLLTSKQCYSNELVGEIVRWLRAYPPLNDANIYDGLENTSRLMCWTHSLFLLSDAPIDEDAYLYILSRICETVSSIELNYDVTRLPNNHQVAEAFALFLAGLIFPELKKSSRWLKKGITLLRENLEAQFRDGVHAEQSTNYHLFVLEIYLVVLRLARRNHVALDVAFAERIERATDYVRCMAKPDLSLPDIGDYGMKFFCPTGEAQYDASTFLAVGSSLFGRQDMAAALHGWPHEAFWIAGRHDPVFDQATTASSQTTLRRLWKEAGHIVVRSGPSGEAFYFHFDFGPQGHGNGAGHSHDDALSFDFCALGEAFIGDTGTYTYVRSHPLREYFRCARGHNAILIDGRGAASLSQGPFAWAKTVDAPIHDYGGSGEVTWFSAGHRGFSDSRGMVEVERGVLIMDSRYVLLVDRVRGKGRRRVESLLHFGPAIKAEMSGADLRCSGSQANLVVRILSSANLQSHMHAGDDEEQPGWFSPIYGVLQEAPVFRSYAETDLPYWQITALLPTNLEVFSPIGLRRRELVTRDESLPFECIAVEIPDPVLNTVDTLVVANGTDTISIAGIRTDARMLVLRNTDRGRQAWAYGARTWQANDSLLPGSLDRGCWL